MYLTVIAWIYVVLMMSVAEATSSTGTVLGALFTFLIYGLLPLTVVVYIMRTPARRRAIKAREAAEFGAANIQPSAPSPPSGEPDASGHPSRESSAINDSIGTEPAGSTGAAPVRKEP